jgi:hypothetical protein
MYSNCKCWLDVIITFGSNYVISVALSVQMGLSGEDFTFHEEHLGSSNLKVRLVR